MFTDGNPLASSGAESSMIVGKLTPPEGLFGALKAVRNGKPMNLAVLLIFSKDLKGKIAIANNRVIIGAAIDGTGQVGQAAFEVMVKQVGGMYGVREAVENEANELQQKLLVDIDRMLAAQHIDVDSVSPSRAEMDINDVDPSYLEWLKGERTKVFSDIEASMNKARSSQQQPAQQTQQPQPAPVQPKAQASNGSSPGGKKWEGLDSIPTPPAVTPERRTGEIDMRPDGSPDRRNSAPQQLPASTRISSVQQLKVSGKYNAAPDLGLSEHSASFSRDTLRDEMEGMETRRKSRIGIAVVAVIGICAFINFWLNSNAVNQVFSDANKHFTKGEYTQAIFLLNDALLKDPGNGRLHLQKGLAHARLQQWDEALMEYDLALAHGASRLPTLLARATVYNEKKDYQKAIAECSAILASHPESVTAYLLMATALDHQSQPEAAEKACTDGFKYAKTPEEKAHLYLERGYALARMHKAEQAEKDLSLAIELQPTLPMYMARGDVYKKLGKYSEAITDYSAVIERDPSNYNALVARAMCENRGHEEEAALKDFAAALKINKHGVEAYIQRGSMYLSRHAYRLAVDDLEDALKLNPQIAETQQKLDAAYKQFRGSTPRLVAAAPVESAGGISSKFKMPGTTPELLKVGYGYLNNGELEYATACFRQAVRLSPSNEPARTYLAHALFEAGDSAGAAAQFEVLNKMSGVDTADILPFSQSLARSGRTARAIQVLESYLATNPRATSYRMDLANLYATNHQVGRAKQILAQGLRISSPTDQARLQELAASFDNMGRPVPTAAQTAASNQQVKEH
jgi:tetratricopeptide (TPR) repeat protein